MASDRELLLLPLDHLYRLYSKFGVAVTVTTWPSSYHGTSSGSPFAAVAFSPDVVGPDTLTVPPSGILTEVVRLYWAVNVAEYAVLEAEAVIS